MYQLYLQDDVYRISQSRYIQKPDGAIYTEMPYVQSTGDDLGYMTLSPLVDGDAACP
jgi:hypothetical protein